MPGERCLIFQRDGSILVTATARGADEARDLLRRFAELVQSAGAYHTYRVTPISLWSAAATGLSASEILGALDRFGEHPPPASLATRVQETLARYGVLRLTGALGRLRLESSDPALLRRVAADHRLAWDEGALVVPDAMRGWLKSALAHDGYPVVDEAAIAGGDAVAIALREGVALRPYQEVAVRQFVARSGSGGVVLLPCGAGKTVVGVAAAARLGCWTLVVTPSRTVAEQWREQFLTLTSLAPDQVGFLARGRTPAPVTIATYQALTSRRAGHALALGEAIDLPWGLVIYDEVHALPAEVFRIAATLQSRRRLGLTATLVREDGRERDVFSLVGPPIFSVPWRDLERQGWIAPVDCVEVRVRPPGERALTAERGLAAKIRVARDLIARHPGEPTLVVAHRLVEVAAAARALGAPMVTGQTPESERRDLYTRFRRGEVATLAVSRVANVGVDLPAASVLIQLSGAFGSRQEEAQRVGRLLRPAGERKRATFYTLVVPGTRETEFAARRQRFLVDQGYRYRVVDAADLAR